MNRHDTVFGRYYPGRSVFHRLQVGWKYLLLIGLTLPAVVLLQMWVSVGLLVVSLALLVATRIPPRLTLRIGPVLLVMVVVIFGYQLWMDNWRHGIVFAANLIGTIYLSRLLIMTTPAPELIDALTVAGRPLDFVGASSERFALTVALVVHSIPYLVGSFGDVQQAVKARGLERNIFAAVTPVVINAVSYARRTGEALEARGLGDE